MDDKGNPLRLNGIIWDVTIQKKMDEILHQTQTLSSLSILAGGIAHDFNNLLNGIKGFIDLAKQADKKSEADEYLEKTYRVLQRAEDLSKHLLTFSKGGFPNTKVIDIADLAKKCSQLMFNGDDGCVELDIPLNLWRVKADEEQISQMLSNIIINAKQAIEGDGKVKITLSNISNVSGECPFLENKKYIRIDVADNGAGMSNEVLSKIFDPFFTTKKGGNGLGLTIAWSIARKHNGYIKVESVQNKGTTLKIYLPASDEEIKNQKTNKSVSNHKGTGNILVMDDEKYIRDLLVNMLLPMGYNVTAAKDGNEAIQLYLKALNDNKPYILVLLDLTIKNGMDGKETIKKLKELDPSVIAVAVSGYSEDKIIINPQDFGFYASLIKPYGVKDMSDLLNKIFVEK